MKKDTASRGPARVKVGAKCRSERHGDCSVLECECNCHLTYELSDRDRLSRQLADREQIESAKKKLPYLRLVCALFLVLGAAGCGENGKLFPGDTPQDVQRKQLSALESIAKSLNRIETLDTARFMRASEAELEPQRGGCGQAR